MPGASRIVENRKKYFQDIGAGFLFPLRMFCWMFWWDSQLRAVLLLLWLASAIWALAAKSTQTLFISRFFLTILTCFVGAILLRPFVRGTFRLYKHGSLPASVSWRIDTNNPSQFSTSRISDLAGLGFELSGFLEKAGTLTRLALFIHVQNKDSAELVHLGEGNIKSDLLVFKTRFDSAFSFETSDSWTPPPSRVLPDCPTFSFPQISSTTDLYRIHRKIKESFATKGHPIVADKLGELAEFMVRAEIVHQQVMENRGYKLNMASNQYTYTWIAAIRAAWQLTWPVRPIREFRARHAALRKARELGFEIDSKLGRIIT